MKAYEIPGAEGGIDALVLAERPRPEPGPGQVRVRISASSLNYRDLATVETPKGRVPRFPLVPNSDGAGEVTALGPDVSEVVVGDRVAGCFFQDWQDGSIPPAAMQSALGGGRDGVLAEEVVLAAHGLVPAPKGLSDAEASTLPCAALTAWHALIEKGGVKPGDTVLLLGTGGVSIFALQFAVMHGARAIITSSSDEKLARARELGAWQTVNYADNADWDQAVIELTGGGVDQTIEVGGPGTLEKSVNATRVAGRVSLIGILSGAAGQVSPTSIMRKSIALQGIYVGSRAMFLRMNRAIEAHGLKPVIDQRFAFDQAPAAYHAMRAAGHFGKLVVSF